MISSETWLALSWWRDWEDLKSLPYGGTDVLQQPAFVTQAIRTCVRTMTEIQTNRARAREREAEQKAQAAQARDKVHSWRK